MGEWVVGWESGWWDERVGGGMREWVVGWESGRFDEKKEKTN